MNFPDFYLPPDPAKGPKATIKAVYNNAIVSETEREIIRDVASQTPIDVEAWYWNLLEYAENLCEPVSPLWARYAGRPGLEIKTSFAFSDNHRMNNQRINALGKLNANNTHSNQCDIVASPRQFAMGVIANDDYEPTIAFVHRMYTKEHGIPFGDAINGFAVITDKVAQHMRRMFWAKWEYKVLRPAQAAKYLLKQSGENNLPLPRFASAHPGHPSFGAGHATCFYSALAECEKYYCQTASPMLHQTADEGGVLRCDLFLHYPEDCQFSFDLTHAFIPDVTEV